ncbi:MAG: hypothetical protein H0T73_11315 [Ardenticatenales bacterium]|nr:hypothetical protein [Ardenticatenales bacterium]
MKYAMGIVIGLLLLLLVACGGAGSQSMGGPTPTVEELPEFIMVYSREGGIAGFCDTLTVSREEAVLEHCGGEVTSIPIEPAVQEELTKIVQQYSSFDNTSEDNPGGTDSMTQQLLFNGVGGETAGEQTIATLTQIATTLIGKAASP